MDFNQTITPVKFPEILSPSKSKNIDIQAELETIIKTIQANHVKWCAAQKRGLSICMSIEAIKIKCFDQAAKNDEKTVSHYPDELKPHTDNLAIIYTIFEDVVKAVQECMIQIDFLVKMCQNPNMIFFRTWKLENFNNFIHLIAKNYEEELKIKKIVTSEIGHSTSKSDLVLHSCAWQYPQYVSEDFEFKFKCFQVETKGLFKQQIK